MFPPAEQGRAPFPPVDFDLRQRAPPEPLGEYDLHVSEIGPDQLFQAGGRLVALHQSQFLLGSDHHGVRPGDGEPVAVLAGMIDFEAVGVMP